MPLFPFLNSFLHPFSSNSLLELFFLHLLAIDMEGKENFEAMGMRKLSWVIMEIKEDEVFDSSTIDSSSENSINSIEPSSSELLEDASSTSTANLSLSSLSSSLSSEPLYELSELMANLPIKRGLSKFYNGKSQSFTSLASAKSLEDLAKRVNNNNSQRKKMKSCKSYGSLDAQRSYSPKALIAKKASKRNSRLFDHQ